MHLRNLKDLSAEDFILDEEFRKIVRNGETDKLHDLKRYFPEKEKEIDLATKILIGLRSPEFRQSDKRKQELWQNIVQRSSRQKRFIYLKYAASVLFVIGFATTLYYMTLQNPDENDLPAKALPDNEALLVLTNGNTVSINSKQSTLQFSSDGSGIIVNDTSEISQPVSGNELNQLIVPFGKRSFILLSEGTKVWLNSGSKLSFPPVFAGKTREVTVEGEAYFEVAKLAGKPFVVKTDAFRMKVLGTKFNIQAYQQDPDYEVILVEGEVSLNSNVNLQSPGVFLSPKQKASIRKGGKDFDVSNVSNTEIYTAWIEGYLIFTNAEVSDVLTRVSRYYNVRIDIELPADIDNIYGKLDLKDDVTRVLDGIAFISKTKYMKQGEKYIFYE